MSVFSDSDLSARQRAAVRMHGTGPESVTDGVEAYLVAEQAAGRIGKAAPVDGAALAQVGARMHRAFLWCFDGDSDDTATEEPARVDTFAAGVVAADCPHSMLHRTDECPACSSRLRSGSAE